MRRTYSDDYQRNMNKRKYSKSLNNLPTKEILKVGIIVALLLLVFVVFKKLGANIMDALDSIFGKKQDKIDEKKDKDREEAIKQTINWNNISYSKAQYLTFCETIHEGLFGHPLTEDERVVWNVFKKMKTNDDVKCLKLYYGRRPSGTLFFPKQSTLSESLAQVFSANELNTCNYLLKRNGLTERV